MPNTKNIKLLAIVILINVFVDSFGTLLLSVSTTAIIRAVSLSVIIIYFFLNVVKLNGIGKLVLVILFYFLILMFFSTSIEKSFWRFSKFAISFLFLPISFSVVKNYSQLKVLNNAIIIAAIFIVINVVFSTVFGIKTAGYHDDSEFSTGNMFSSGLFTGVYFVILSPLILKNHSIFSRKTVFFLILAIVIINFLVMKRSTIIVLMAGVFVYSLLNKQVLNKYVLILGFGVTIAFFVFGEMFISRFESREKKLQIDSFQNESRYTESLVILEDILSFNDPIYSFSGRELFNTVGHYGGGRYGAREIHNDYMVLLNGSGLVGLFLYLFLFVKLYFIFLRIYQKDRKQLKELYVFFVLLMMTSLLISFNGGMAAIGYRSIGFIYLGSLLGIAENTIKQKQFAESKINNSIKKII